MCARQVLSEGLQHFFWAIKVHRVAPLVWRWLVGCCNTSVWLCGATGRPTTKFGYSFSPHRLSCQSTVCLAFLRALALLHASQHVTVCLVSSLSSWVYMSKRWIVSNSPIGMLGPQELGTLF